MITKTGRMKFVIIFGFLIIFSISLANVYALQQTAGKAQFDIKPGDTQTFLWGLKSDEKDRVITVELSADKEGSEFLLFEKFLELPPQELIYITITVSVPDDYPGGIELNPKMYATQYGEEGGVARINVRMVKTVTLNIAPNADPDLRVDWDAIKAAQGLQAESESQAPQAEQQASQEEAPTGQESQGLQIEEQTTQMPKEPSGPLTIGSAEPEMDPEPEIDPEPGMELEMTDEGGGCLIATATYGSELAPQVQLLREIRDNTILNTKSGTTFMAGFNQFYYSFSPTIADWERQNPVFKELVKITITPLLTSLSILNHVDVDSEAEMLGYGVSIILLNVGMYFVGPAILITKLKKRI